MFIVVCIISLVVLSFLATVVIFTNKIVRKAKLDSINGKYSGVVGYHSYKTEPEKQLNLIYSEDEIFPDFK